MNKILVEKSFTVPPGSQLNFGKLNKHILLMLLADFLRSSNPNRSIRILEVGVWIGFLTRSLCEFLERTECDFSVTCVDSWKPYHHQKDLVSHQAYTTLNQLLVESNVKETFQLNLSKFLDSGRVNAIQGNSLDILPQVQQKFDLIFVDGSHYYSEVLEDILNSKNLLAEGGIICGDDFEGSQHLGRFSPQDFERDTVSIENQKFHPGVIRAVTDVFGNTPSWDGTWAYRFNSSQYSEAFSLISGIERWVYPSHFNESQKAILEKDLNTEGTALFKLASKRNLLN